MRIAISAEDTSGLESVVSPHFGRCPHYVLVDVEGQEVKAVQSVGNPYYSQHSPGQVPGFINDQGVTGGMGRRAIVFFEQYGIEAVTGASGTVRYALERYLGGQLRGVQPCRESSEHAHGELAPSVASLTVEGYEQDEVGRLREEAEMLRRQLDEVTARLDKLGK